MSGQLGSVRDVSRDQAILAIARAAHASGKLFPTRATLARQFGCSVPAADRAVMRLVDEGRLTLRFSQTERKRRMVVEDVA